MKSTAAVISAIVARPADLPVHLFSTCTRASRRESEEDEIEEEDEEEEMMVRIGGGKIDWSVVIQGQITMILTNNCDICSYVSWPPSHASDSNFEFLRLKT